MKELFNVPMTTLMFVMLAIFAIAVASVLFVFITNRVMFRMGLRNLPRRGLQTGLVIIGLMLSTLIVAAAFTTGDTVDYSITSQAYDGLQRTDLVVDLRGKDPATADGQPVYFGDSAVAALEQRYAGDPDIEGFQPFLFEPVPVSDGRTHVAQPRMMLTGVDPDRMTQLGGLPLATGGSADLGRLSDTEVLLSKTSADELDARVGDVVTVYVEGQPHELRVAGVVNDQLATSGPKPFYEKYQAGAVMRLDVLQALTGRAGQINYLGIALKGGVRESVDRSQAAALRLQPFLDSPAGHELLGAGDRAVEVQQIKHDAIKEAQLNASLFTTFFLVLGMFSVAAGIMLIFMIFVMLAAERKPEMGMARAVGAQRTNLVQSFVSEGMAYTVVAGAIGALFGVLASIALVVGFLKYAGGFDFVQAHVTARSLVVAYCGGVVVTFISVVVASIKVTNVNIVAAIRGTDEDGKRKPRPKTRWRWVLGGIPALVVPPLGAWLILRKGFGVAWTWILAPAGIGLALLSILAAKSSGSEFLFSFGASVIPLCAAMIASHYRAPSRLTWTLVGVYLAAYWLSPVRIGDKVLGEELNGDIEMFLLSGVMVVIAFTLIIVHNARLLTMLFQRTGNRAMAYRTSVVLAVAAVGSATAAAVLGNAGDGLGQLLYLFAALLAAVAAFSFAAVRYPRFAPALKMGVAYPLANRFRTGMTIAMFSLIVFSLTVFSIINNNFTQMTAGKDGDGGWDLIATVNRNNPIPSVRDALVANGSGQERAIAAEGRVSEFTGSQEVRQAGQADFEQYPVLAADDAFFRMPDTKLEEKAYGYATDADVLEAVRAQPNLALVDFNATSDNGSNTWDWSAHVGAKDGRFKPFEVTVRDPGTGKSTTVTVIGVLAAKLESKWVAGIFTNAATYAPVFGEPKYVRSYISLQGGASSKTSARDMQSAVALQGVEVKSVKALLDDATKQSVAFGRMFQGFLALGLFVGIAALGVIAFRSVVERRQQIGMLRAIGYQTGTVALTFVLESSFIALMGIVSGVVGGAVVSRNLFSNGAFSDAGVAFSIPWTEVTFFVVAAFVVSLLMTWLPSRNAARVPVADALRYE